MRHRQPICKVEKVWGKEVWLVNNERYGGKILYFRARHRGSLHYHKNKHETFFLRSGVARVQISDDVFFLHSGEIVDLPAGTAHRIEALTDLEIFEFSTTHDDADTYRLEISA